MAKLGKRTRTAREAFVGKTDVSVEDAVKLVKSYASAKFDETFEVALNLGVDPRHEHVLPGSLEGRCNLDDLLGGLPRSVDDFGNPLTQRAMCIHAGMLRIHELRSCELLLGRIDRDAAGTHVLEQSPKRF